MLRGARSLNSLAIAVAGICGCLFAATYTAQASHVAVQWHWPPPLDLSQSGGSSSRDPVLAMQQNGDLHVLWLEKPRVLTETLPDRYTLYHARSDRGGCNWTYSVPLTPSGYDRGQGAMDVDQDGLAHTVWVEHPYGFELWYALLSGDSWEEQTTIRETDEETYIVAPDLVVATDTIHVVWSEMNYGKHDIFYSRSEIRGYWIPATTTVETGQTSLNPRMAADPAGNLHLVWQENTTSPQIYYISGTVGFEETVWSTTTITVSEGLTQTATTPDIAVGPNNTVHVVFAVNVENQPYFQDIYYASFPVTDSGVVSATLIPGSRVKVTGLLPGFASPALAVFGTDEVYMAWNGRMGEDNSDRIYYAVSEDGGQTWSDPIPLSPENTEPDGFPSLAADGQAVHLVWQEKVSDTDQDICYTRRFSLRFPCPLAMKAY